MSLTQLVAGLIEDAGRGSVLTIEKYCKGYTRKQVATALASARASRLIQRVGFEGLPNGGKVGVYEPAPEQRERPRPKAPTVFPPSPLRVASVWEWRASL